MDHNTTIAATILTQLGSGAFACMTGATNFCAINNGLQFDLPKQRGFVRDGINRVHVVLNCYDTYDVIGYRVQSFQADELHFSGGVYCDQLKRVFERMTGLYTEL